MAIPNLSTLNEIALVGTVIFLALIASEIYVNWTGIVRTWDHMRLFRYNPHDPFIRTCRKCDAEHTAYTVRMDDGASVVGWWRVSEYGYDAKCRCNLYVHRPTNVTPKGKKDETV